MKPNLLAAVLAPLSWRMPAKEVKTHDYPSMVTASPMDIEAWNSVIAKRQRDRHMKRVLVRVGN